MWYSFIYKYACNHLNLLLINVWNRISHMFKIVKHDSKIVFCIKETMLEEIMMTSLPHLAVELSNILYIDVEIHNYHCYKRKVPVEMYNNNYFVKVKNKAKVIRMKN